MDNIELQSQFENIKIEIEQKRANGEDVTALLRTQVKLLREGYDKISEATSGAEFATNPRKYSTLLSYINNMRSILIELNDPTDEVDVLDSNVREQMDKNGLGWLLEQV